MGIDVDLAIYIDWDKDGFGAGDEVTGDVRDGTIVLGITEPDARVASVGELSLVLDNSDRAYSPNYASGPHYGKLVPKLPVKVEATISGVGTVQLCYMETYEWFPHSQLYGDRYAELLCYDRMNDLLENESITLPLRQDATADVLLKQILAATYKTAAASGTATFSSNPSDGDTITVDGVAITFSSGSVADAGDVLIGATASDTAENLAAALNGDNGAGSKYIAPDTRPRVAATVSGAEVTIYADARGAWGNAITLAETGTAITLSGATLSGGVDGPTGATFDFDTGVQTFDYAADQWSSGDLNAMTAVQQVCDSEFGLFAFARDGDPIFRNTHYLFEAANGTALDIDNTQTALDARVSLLDVRNYATVSWRPRRTLTSGTIARANSVIEIPGTDSHEQRWASYDDVPAITKTITLPFVDDRGNSIGALSVDPLVPNTHYRVTDFEDGSGFDYATGPAFSMSWAVTGGQIEITMSNTATGSLYVHDLYVEGVGLVTYEQQQIARQNTDSIDAYGKKTRTYDIPFGVSGTWPEDLAAYLASVDADPYLKASTATFRGNLDTAASSHLLTVGLFDLVDITEAQTGITDLRYAVVGWECAFSSEDVTELTFHLRPVSNLTYWLLGETGYSELGDTTRLGL